MKSTSIKLTLLFAVAVFAPGFAEARPVSSFLTETRFPITSETRQLLRKKILETASAKAPNIAAIRASLALPLAKLGDFEGAVRLVSYPKYNVRSSDELWRWRCYQLTRSHKWDEVIKFIPQIFDENTQADALLFAIRAAIEQGVSVKGDEPQSKTLRHLLEKSTGLIKIESVQLQAYAAYLWARAGDSVMADRVFQRAYEAGKKKDADDFAQWTKYADGSNEEYFRPASTEDVLRLMVRAGKTSQALDILNKSGNNAARLQEFISRLIYEPGVITDFNPIATLINTWPTQTRRQMLFMMASSSAARGDKEKARQWFAEAHQLKDEKAPDPSTSEGKRYQFQVEMMNYSMARTLGDEAELTRTEDFLRKEYAKLSPKETGGESWDWDLMVIAWEFQRGAMTPGASKPKPPENLDGIAQTVLAAKPSQTQLELLQMVADFYWQKKDVSKLKPVARAMYKSAVALEAVEAKNRQEFSRRLGGYRTVESEILTAILWLQRADERSAADAAALEFAKSTAIRDRPFAAKALLQLRYGILADSIFDSKREIVNWQKTQRKSSDSDWATYWSWGQYAALETQTRGATRPLQWLAQMKEPYERANLLIEWINVLFPEPKMERPYVQASYGGYSASI